MLLYATDSEIAYFSHKEVSSDEGAFHRSEEKLITVLQLQSLAMCLLGAGGCACGLSTLEPCTLYKPACEELRNQQLSGIKFETICNFPNIELGEGHAGKEFYGGAPKALP